MTATIPQRGTRDYEMWLAGAAAEHDGAREGMLKQSEELYECVRIMGQQGDSAQQIAWFIAVVFTCEQSLRWRLRLARRLILGSRWRRTWKVYVEPRDWWVGYYRGDQHHYVCFLPCVVLRWNRRQR